MGRRSQPRTPRGRGAVDNPPPRFARLWVEVDPESAGRSVATEFLRDTARSALTFNESPDVGYAASLNPYRGCEHGCAYCYARPTHEYLGYSAGLDFETRILVKEDAPALLRRELSSPGWQPRTIALSGVTDPYQPVERRLRLTRRCLEVLAEFRNPVSVVTKNHLVCRDADLLAVLAGAGAAAVALSVSTLDVVLGRDLEPRTSSPEQRLGAIAALAAAGVPVGVLVAPAIPGLTDHEVSAIVAAAAARGASFAACQVLRLPYGVGELFAGWLERHRPTARDKVLGRVRELHGGRLDDHRFGRRMVGDGQHAAVLRDLFESACRRAGIAAAPPALSSAGFRRPGGEQRSLFET